MLTDNKSSPLILALPKGRILDEVMPLVKAAGIEPEADFFDDKSRKLRFKTNLQDVDIIRVRAFDAATFVAFGAAHLGVVGSDVLEEFEYDDLYAPLDLNIGHCRLSLAVPDALREKIAGENAGHIRVATKYPNITRRYYGAKGVQAECIKLNGAMEIAPALGLADRIVDLVSTGGTLKANQLTPIEDLMTISSRLVVSRVAYKTRSEEISHWLTAFGHAVNQQQAA